MKDGSSVRLFPEAAVRIIDTNPSTAGDQDLKSITIYKPSGEIFKTYPQILAHNTENGLMAFRYERKPGDRTSIEKVITNLPFVLEDDTV